MNPTIGVSSMNLDDVLDLIQKRIDSHIGCIENICDGDPELEEAFRARVIELCALRVELILSEHQ